MDSLKFWLDDTDKLFLPEADMSGVVCDLLANYIADPSLPPTLLQRATSTLHSISTAIVTLRAVHWLRSCSH